MIEEVVRRVPGWLKGTDRSSGTAPRDPELLVSAAHELRTPLTTLLAQAQDLERRQMREPGSRPDIGAIRRIAREAARLRSLIQELLDAAAIEQGRLELAPEPLDLVELARAASAARSGSACQVNATGPVIGAYDRQRMRVVLESLIDNAMKYGEGAAARMVVWQQGDRAFVAVQDRGSGIPAEDVPKVFDRSYRGANAADHAVPGLGLGLYLARAIVQAHGGAIALYSTPFEGTTVSVVLPCPPAAGAIPHA